MFDATGSDRSRRKFLEDLGVSAAALVAGGEVCGLQAREPMGSGEPSGGKERPDAPTTERPRFRQEVDLSGDWCFQVDNWNEGEKWKYFSLDYPTSDWRKVSIPRGFDDCAP